MIKYFLGMHYHFLLCVSAGVISTMVSYMCKTASGRLYPSLGAVRGRLKPSYILTKNFNNSSVFDLPFSYLFF